MSVVGERERKKKVKRKGESEHSDFKQEKYVRGIKIGEGDGEREREGMYVIEKISNVRF